MDRRVLMSPESAQASDIFDKFCTATTLKGILNHYRHLCNLLKLKPTHFPEFYPRIRQKLCSWRAQGLWSKFEKRASHKCYARGQACAGSRVLIIGGGPCGLRTAIEAQLLGAKVVLIEKRDRFSRNNVLHLWPFVITDLKALGAKKFYGKFCAGSIDHISIRQLQCILLKVALLLGVEIHEGVGFEGLMEPTDDEGWRAVTSPSDHPVSHYNFNCLIGADGRRNTLDGFKRKALRAKLAIAITANFINKRTEAEARVKEISGVSYIFNQKFFQDLNEATGIDLENIVYYKDETHYFVMTAKKQSLLSKGVLLNDYPDTAQLLAHDNINTDALEFYALEAAVFSTENQLPNLEFAVNHYGQPDVAMFDFTAMYAAENACRVVQRNGQKLMMTLVGDSLLEPFWPTGSGCARGFLSSFDACWMLRGLASGLRTTMEVIAERESLYRLLAQTTPENLNKEHANYTIDPHTRYPNLNQKVVMPFQVKALYDTDETFPEGVIGTPEQALDGTGRLTKKRRRDADVPVETLLTWIRDQVRGYGLDVNSVADTFIRGDILCAIVHRFRPDLIEFPPISEENLDPMEIVAQRNELAFDFLHKEYDIAPVISGIESAHVNMTDFPTLVSYLSQLYDAFRGEIPQVKYPRVDGTDEVDELSAKSSHSYVRYGRPSLVVKPGPSARAARRSRVSTAKDGEHVEVRRHRKSRRTEERVRASLGKEIRTTVAGHQEAEKVRVTGLAKNLEEKLRGHRTNDKKPKDLIRAIGKIEKSDWNVQLIEKKIAESRTHEQSKKEHDKVPKWSREAYDDKREAMKRKMEGGTEKSLNEREKLFEETVKKLGNKLKEGNALDIGQRGCNKVSQMAEQLSHKFDTPMTPTRDTEMTPRPRPIFELPTKGGSELCHFCNQRVYVVERMTTEGKYFHRNCFRCEYCNTSLRLGNYVFEREGKYGERFYCPPHFQTVKLYGWKKFDQQHTSFKSEQEQLAIEGRSSFLNPTTHQILSEMDDRGTTPERVEFENSVDFASEEELLSEMDEDEWTDRNFGASKVESNTSDEASDLSDDDELTPDGNTAENKQAYGQTSKLPETGDSSDSDTEIASGTGTGSEEEASSNELDEDDGEEEREEDECEGSTTEVETDSEFAEDPPHLVPGKIPTIVVEEHGKYLAAFVDGGRRIPAAVSKPQGAKLAKSPRSKPGDDYGELPVVEPVLRTDLPKGRALPKVYAAPKKWEPLANLESQPEAAKYSSELKKKYLEGVPTQINATTTKKCSDPATQNKFSSLLDMISEKQKLLQPASEPSPTMQAFLEGAEKLKNKTGLTGLRCFDTSTPEEKKRFQNTPSPSDILILSKAEEEMINMNLKNLERSMSIEKSMEMTTGSTDEFEKGDDGKEVYNLDTDAEDGSCVRMGDNTNLNIESMLISSDTLSSQSQSQTESQCTIKAADNEDPKLYLSDENHSESGSGEDGSVSCPEEVSDSDVGEDAAAPIAHFPPRVEIEDEFGISLSLDEDKAVRSRDLASANSPSIQAAAVCTVSSSDSKESLNSAAFLEADLSEWSRETGHQGSQKGTQMPTTSRTSSEVGIYDVKAPLALLMDESIDFADLESEGPSSARDGHNIGVCSQTPDKSEAVHISESSSKSNGVDAKPSVECGSGSITGLNNPEVRREVPVDVDMKPKDSKTTLNEAVNTSVAVPEPPKDKGKYAMLDRVIPFSKARDSLDYRKMKNTTNPSKTTSVRNYKHLSSVKALAKDSDGEPTCTSNNHESGLVQDQPATLSTQANESATNISRSPITVRRLEQINQERSKQNDLIKSMVMDRIRRSPEKTKRGSRGSLTLGSTEYLSRSEKSSPQVYESGSGTSFSSVSDDPSQKSDALEAENTVIDNSSTPRNGSVSKYMTPENNKRNQRASLHEADVNDSFDMAIRSIRDAQRGKSYFDSPNVGSKGSISINVTSTPTSGQNSHAPSAPSKKSPEERREGNNFISPSFYRSMPDLSNPAKEEDVIGQHKVSSSVSSGDKTKVAQRSISLVGHERAREEARERARLKTDEELEFYHPGHTKNKPWRKLSFAKDAVFNPDAAITARVSSRPVPSGTGPVAERCSYTIGEFGTSGKVAAPKKQNVDLPIKKDPFLASVTNDKEAKARSTSGTDDFLQLNLHVASKPSEASTKTCSYHNFPTFFSTPSKNWREEYIERDKKKTHTRSHTVTGIKLENAPSGSGTVGFPNDSETTKYSKEATNRTQGHNTTHALLHSHQFDTNPSASRAPNKTKALSTETLLDNAKFALAPEGEPFRSGVSVPDVTHDFAPSETKPKRSKDRTRRRSLIQAMSDFFTTKSPSATKSPTSTDQDKSSSTSSPSTSTPKDNKFSIFKLTPKLLQKERLSVSPDSAGLLRNSGALASAKSSSKPAKNPRASFLSYISQPELLVQRLSNSPMTSTSSQGNVGGTTSSGSSKDASPSVRQGKSKHDISSAEKRRKNDLLEIQLQMEFVETEQRQLEGRGVSIERKLRGEEDDEGQDHDQLMEEWFTLVREKVRLSRYEKGMLVRARELELDFKAETLEDELETSLLVDESVKSPEDKSREAGLFQELNDLRRQREALLASFHEEMLKYEREDAELDARCSTLSPRESNV